MFKTIDQKIEELGFKIIKNDKYRITYSRWNGSDITEGGYEHVVVISHKQSGKHILQSYCPSLYDNQLIGNSCVGLTYNELKLFIKKMNKLVRRWSKNDFSTGGNSR